MDGPFIYDILPATPVTQAMEYWLKEEKIVVSVSGVESWFYCCFILFVRIYLDDRDV